jgi:hypothetical protein
METMTICDAQRIKGEIMACEYYGKCAAFGGTGQIVCGSAARCERNVAFCDLIIVQQQRIAALAHDKDEQAGKIMRMENLLKLVGGTLKDIQYPDAFSRTTAEYAIAEIDQELGGNGDESKG